jgi:hypothetical protein
MSRSTLRRTVITAVLVAAAGLGAEPATADPAVPDQRRDVREQVIRDQSDGLTNIVVPDRAAPGARVRSVPRIGQADATPPEQTWLREIARNGRGTFNLVHTPSAGDGGRKLCLDVQGDSLEVGAPLVLRPCDGTDSQAWSVPAGFATFTQLINRDSGLNAELVGGRLVQAAFPERDDPDARERNRLQGFSIVPRTFGFGGA